MHTVETARPSRDLLPYVRGYAQRRTRMSNSVVFQSSPACLETTLNFEFGDHPSIRRHQRNFSSHDVDVIGSQTYMYCEVGLCGNMDSFAAFFHPTGFAQLFGVPIHELMDQADDVTSLLGLQVRSLWNELGENSSLKGRVCILERFLLERTRHVRSVDKIVRAANYVIATHGVVQMPNLARQCGLGLRHFQRRFQATAGVTAKHFARIARFQMALETKVALPQRSWLDIAHALHYHDQMHMVHDFQSLGGDSPGRLIELLGDMRPLAIPAVGEDRTVRGTVD
jgi:AraC-like DNA-binding protein